MNEPASTLQDTVSRLGPIEPELRLLGVRRLALFGSVLRGAANAASDVDLLVDFMPGQKDYDRFLRLADVLEDRLGRRVELVTIESLSPIFGSKILAEAQDVFLIG